MPTTTTRIFKGKLENHPALLLHPWASGLMTEILKRRFPWLGTEKSIDYRDECCKLADLYVDLKRMEAKHDDRS